ncbi:MAG: hypothetical protein HQK99_13425 [Nitrospirae bacterium]|nr:hypothetical protein [Nitrospirota bacterium]
MNFSINIHSLVRIRLSNLHFSIADKLRKYFNLFITDSAEISGNYDIEVMPFTTETKSYALASKTIMPFWIKELNNDAHVVIGHRGNPAMAFNVSGPITLYYCDKTQDFSKLLLTLTYCIQLILLRKGGILFHGAVLSRGNECILFVGPSSVGKTSLTVAMLNDGWDYLSDDKFILHKGMALMFRHYIPMERCHLDYLKSKCLISVSKRFKYPNVINQLAKVFVEQYSPEFAIPLFGQLCSPFVFVDVNEMFPECRPRITAKPSKCVVLMQSASFRFQQFSYDDIIRDIVNIQWLHFPNFEKLTRILSLSDYSYNKVFEAVIFNNLANMQFYKLNFPYEWNQEKLYEAVLNGINP